MQTAINYLKRFVAWATALRARYASKYSSDLYFRTSVHIVTLQVGFATLCVAAFALALIHPSQGWSIFGALLLVALLCGIFLSRFTLGPAKDTARYQKLFISNIAHELRTPLSTIKTSSEVALIDPALEPDIKKTFTEIIEELNRISEIINNLLSLNTLTRPERMQLRSIDIAPIAEEVARRHAPLARERGIKMSVRQEPGAVVWGNAIALEQMMVNLVKNALSYTPAGAGGQVVVSVRPAEAGMVLFSVADTGVGIAQEDLFHIFEPFYRVESSRNRAVGKSGSGLGLTIVNEMVRAHQGRIHIESQRRAGTTVSVYLPQGGVKGGKQTGNPERGEATIDFSTGAEVRR